MDVPRFETTQNEHSLNEVENRARRSEESNGVRHRQLNPINPMSAGANIMFVVVRPSSNGVSGEEAEVVLLRRMISPRRLSSKDSPHDAQWSNTLIA